jgi:hypothetical protein
MAGTHAGFGYRSGKVRARVSVKSQDAAQTRARMREAEMRAESLRLSNLKLQRVAEMQERRAKDAEARSIRGRLGKVAGAVRRIFSRGKV